jgi:cytochrome b6
MAEVEFGWLIRSIHAWAANLMVFTLFVHLFSVLLLKAYRPPREITWVSGVVLLALALGFGFTGYLLPWNELAYFATKVGTEIPGVLPGIGPFLRRFLRGGDEVTGATLTRFYGIHVAVLPALTVLLLALHLFLVQKHGMSVPPGVEREGGARRTMPFVPNYLLRDIVGWLSALAVLATLAAFWPAELGKKADPFARRPWGSSRSGTSCSCSTRSSSCPAPSWASRGSWSECSPSPWGVCSCSSSRSWTGGARGASPVARSPGSGSRSSSTWRC